MRKLIVAIVMTLALLSTVTLGAFAKSPSSSPSARPLSYPSDCLGIYPSSSNVSRTSTALSYNLYASVKNECTKVLLGDGSGGWIANFVVDCEGDMIEENPYLTGGLPQIKVGASVTFLDGHWVSDCEDQFGDKFAPVEVTINLSASGNLQGGGVATGSTYITVS